MSSRGGPWVRSPRRLPAQPSSATVPSHGGPEAMNETPANGSGVRATSRARIAAAAITGTTIGWYDFFLFLGAMPLVFFPRPAPGDQLPALVLLGAGFVGRFAGGALFGHFGDRLGRRSTLVATLLTLGLPTAAIGLLPGQA